MSTPENSTANRLIHEKSAYLRQHAHNPVEWWPYGEEALKRARELNRPIFLSIGYSSCHWCHVMAHESFEDQETAKYLNEHFVSIKVDREEHPDVDQYYQEVCQLYNRNGGWPLSAFLLPDMGPFFVGTYFPNSPRHGLPSFRQVLTELNRVFKEQRDSLETDAEKIKNILRQGPRIKDRIEFQGECPHPGSILNALKDHQDNTYGGYSGAPKFPMFAFYDWALEQALEGRVSQEQGQHLFMTLERMLMGGIFDQARGGLHRYSTDEKWLVPHFEKMLYDQAGLLKVLSKISLIAPTPLFLEALSSTLDYLEKEMLGEEGFFFSAQDADSEGHEGLYFSFTREEFRSALEADESLKNDIDQLEKWFQISEAGNFEGDLNVVSLNYDLREEIFQKENWEKVRKVKASLLQARRERIPPETDTKGIASWNFFLLTALCDVAQYAPSVEIKNRARKLLFSSFKKVHDTFLSTVKVEGSQVPLGRLRHTTTKETSAPYLEDYVFYLEAMLRFYELTGVQELKKTMEEAVHYIYKEFVSGDRIYNRGLSTNQELGCPNTPAHFYDQSFRSPAATLLAVTKRLAALLSDKEILEKAQLIKEECRQLVLHNPLASGEGLRALTYPDHIFKKIEIPMGWLQNGAFLNFWTYLPPRFVLDFHQEPNERWQICGLQVCEKQGEGAEELIKTLAPQQTQNSDSQVEDSKQDPQ